MANTRSCAALVTSGLMIVAESNGSPSGMFRTASITLAATSSYTSSWRSIRDGIAQPWPASTPQTLKALTSAAMSRFASGNTRLADLPPNSSTAGLSDSAHAARIFFAVAGPPVKLTFCTAGWRTSASPVSGPPIRRLTTPAGMPASPDELHEPFR